MHWNTEPNFTYKNESISKEELWINIMIIKDNAGTSEYHVPEGCLMIYGKNSNRYKNLGKIVTHEIKNLVLNYFDK